MAAHVAHDDDPGVTMVHRLAMECVRDTIHRPGMPRPSVARLDMLEEQYGPEYVYALVTLVLDAWHDALVRAHPGMDDAGLRAVADRHLAAGRAVGSPAAAPAMSDLARTALDSDDPDELGGPRAAEIWQAEVAPNGLHDEVLLHLLVMVRHAWDDMVVAGAPWRR